MTNNTLQICNGMNNGLSLQRKGYNVLSFIHTFDGPLKDFKTYDEYEKRFNDFARVLQDVYGCSFNDFARFEQDPCAFQKDGSYHDEYERMFFGSKNGKLSPISGEDFHHILRAQEEVCFWLSPRFEDHILLSLVIQLFDLYGIDPQILRIKIVTEFSLETVLPSLTLTKIQIDYFRQAWASLTSPTPDKIMEMIRGPQEFFFKDGLVKYLERFPYSQTGINGCERAIFEAYFLEALYEGKDVISVARVIGRAWFGRYHYSDSFYIHWRLINMTDKHAKQPVFIFHEDHSFNIGNFYTGGISLTDFGRAVFTGKAKWLEENDIEYDVGGLHLSSKNNQMYFSDMIFSSTCKI